MPELSEVEISRRQLERWWLDQSVKDVILEDTKLMPAGVFNAIKRTMTSSKPKAFKRRGKVLLIEFAGGRTHHGSLQNDGEDRAHRPAADQEREALLAA